MAFFSESILDAQIDSFRRQDLCNFAWIEDELLERYVNSFLVSQLDSFIENEDPCDKSCDENYKGLKIPVPANLLPTIQDKEKYVGEWGVFNDKIYYWSRKNKGKYEISKYTM